MTLNPAHKHGFGTLCIHAGQDPDPVTGAVIPSLSTATTFVQSSPGVHKGFEYSRSGNPSRNNFEVQVAAAEGAKHGLAFASGSAALATIIEMYGPNDHIICVDDVYGGTNRYFKRVASVSGGLKVSFVDCTHMETLAAAFTPETKLLWAETPTNPLLKLVDIRLLAEEAHKRNVLLVIDNTFATPFFQRPLDHGADIVVHSVSKYINGHSDVIGGVVVTNSDELHTRLRFLQNAIGAIPSPFDCHMATRGMKTLHLRMAAHEQNALVVAKFLEGHPQVESLSYPGLPSHPQHELAKRQMSGFGGMITMWLKGGLAEAKAFSEGLKLFAFAESLGGVECLAEHPAIMTHASVPAEERAKLGISDSMIRLSIGVENVEDILQDLRDAFANIPK